MLKIIRSMHQIEFFQLTQVYEKSLWEDARSYPDNSSEFEVVRKAEDRFYDYLMGWLYESKENMLFVWEHDGRYVSAVRLEPYKDGYLISGLETKPSEYNKGFAKQLLREVVSHVRQQGNARIYSHVEKKNAASLAVHRCVGFTVIDDVAVYIDGTVTTNSFTLSIQ